MLIDGVQLIEGSDITNPVVDSGTAFPSNPNIGELFYKTSATVGLYVYDGAGWTAAGGGTSDAGSLSGTTLAANVVSSSLTSVGTLGSLSVTGNVTAAEPTLSTHLATKNYVDSVAVGVDPKASVRVATTVDCNLFGTQTIDGVALAAGDRVLVKNQAAPAQNGIYVVVSGNNWTRATDFDGSPSSEVTSGAYCFVTAGSTQAQTGWILTTADPITIGSTALTFAQFYALAAAPSNIAGGSAGTIAYQSSTNTTAFSTKFTYLPGSNLLQLGTTNSAAEGHTIQAATGTTVGHSLAIVGGAGGGANNGGAVTIAGGVQNTAGGASGAVTIHSDGAAGGAVTIRGGDAAANGASGTAGSLTLRGGDSTNGATSGIPGNVVIRAGNAVNTQAGGSVTIQGGTSSAGGGALVFQTAASTSLTTRLTITNAGLIQAAGRLDMTSYTENSSAITSSATQNIDCSLGTVFPITLSTSITSLTFSNVPTTGKAFSMSLFVTQAGGGSKLITWPASVKWSGATAPTLTTTDGKTDVFTLVTFDGGTNWFGFVGGLNF